MQFLGLKLVIFVKDDEGPIMRHTYSCDIKACNSLRKVTKFRVNLFVPLDKSLNAEPLEAILVIFGRSSLVFPFESSWENMEKDTTFVRMRSGDQLEDINMSKKGTTLRRI